MPRVLIAFDKFKHSMDALSACRIAAEVIESCGAGWETDLCPLTDGGEGFARILTHASGGEWEPCIVTGPRGEPAQAGLGWIKWKDIPSSARENLLLDLPGDARIALVEMALASGIESLTAAQRDPWLTHTTGTGELLALAARRQADAILLGIGGSATNDAGLGALSALGVEAVDADGKALRPPSPLRWRDVSGFRGHPAKTFPPLRIACDVDNPLLGPNGCTLIFGPQKGLRPDDAARMETLMERVSARLCDHTAKPVALRQTPGAGAAGGIGFGLLCSLPDTRFVQGHRLVARWLDIEKRLSRADLLITGEGRFDASSLSGKGPGSLLRMASLMGKPSLLVAGSLAEDLALPSGAQARVITPAGLTIEEALPRGPEFLAATIRSALMQELS